MQKICQVIADCPHTTPKFQPTGIQVVRNFNIRNGRFIPEPAFFTTEREYLQRTSRAVPQSGDILFSREAPVGEACLIPANVKVSLGQRVMLIRTKAAILDPFFMVYSFYSPIVRSRMLATASGLTVPHLNVSDVRAMQVPVPDLAEQQKIGSVLNAVASKQSLLERKCAALQDLFRTLLHQLMTAQIHVNHLDLSEMEKILS